MKNIKNENHDEIIKYFSSTRVNLWDIVNDAFSEDFDRLGYIKVHSVEEYQSVYVNSELDPIINY
jgi:hypothetical protein